MKYFKKNMHYLLVTLYLFSLQINAFSFDNKNDLNIGISISEKTYTNKVYENSKNNKLTFPANAGIDADICFGDSYQIGEPGDQSLFIYSWTSSPLDINFDDVFYMEKIFIGERIRDIKYNENSKTILLALEDSGIVGILYEKN